MEEFVKVCRVDELIDGKGRKVIIDDIDVLLIKSEEKIYALSNVCPHQHRSIMHDGFCEGDKVICPAHGWQFKLADGRIPVGGLGLDVYDVKVENDDVYVKAFNKKFNW